MYGSDEDDVVVDVVVVGGAGVTEAAIGGVEEVEEAVGSDWGAAVDAMSARSGWYL